MLNIKLIYDKNNTWEKDFIQELFSNINFDLIFVEPEILKNKLENEESIINNNILFFSLYKYSFDEILTIVKRIQPKIIFYLSDEWGHNPEYSCLASYTKLFLHQYHFKHYPYKNYNNIFQLPLGYMTNMFQNKKGFNLNVKPILERKYTWSFIGTIKQDRLEIIDKFSKQFNKKFVGNYILPSDMFTIYNDSIFVPVGRGNSSVDCFRIYEAIFSGSIPVIICTNEEFEETFCFNNDIPPFIHEKTCDELLIKCNLLLNNKDKLIDIQAQNYNWLQNKIKSIQDLIHSTLL